MEALPQESRKILDSSEESSAKTLPRRSAPLDRPKSREETPPARPGQRFRAPSHPDPRRLLSPPPKPHNPARAQLALAAGSAARCQPVPTVLPDFLASSGLGSTQGPGWEPHSSVFLPEAPHADSLYVRAKAKQKTKRCPSVSTAPTSVRSTGARPPSLGATRRVPFQRSRQLSPYRGPYPCAVESRRRTPNELATHDL